MCGIAGYLTFHSPSDLYLTGIGNELLKTVRFRGPDDEGTQIFRGENIAGVLCHTRLSIVGLGPEGHQPMVSEDGRFVLVFNGEIFNFKELIQRFDLSVKTNTDSEVLLLLWQRFGLECLPHLDGFFAFALWDNNRESCYLVRDRTGVKPLYFAEIGSGTWVFGSDERTILKAVAFEGLEEIEHSPGFIPDSRAELVGKVQKKYLEDCMQGFSDRVSPFGFIESVPSGSYRRISGSATDPEGAEKRVIDRWFNDQVTLDFPSLKDKTVASWDSFLKGNVHAQTVETILNRLPAISEKATVLRRQLFMSVARRLQSDVPIGFALSGGVDSAAITAIAALILQETQQPVVTFSVGSKDFAEDESRWQLCMVDFLGTKHVGIDTSEFSSNTLEEFVAKTGRPSLHWNNIAHYELCKRVKQEGVTVFFNGQGADEIFAGYPHYYVHQLFREWGALIPQRSKWPLDWRQAIQQSVKSRFKGIYTRNNSAKLSLYEMLRADYFGDRLTQLLRFEDRNGMAHQLESRNPFADDYLLSQWLGISQLDEEYENSWGFIVGELSGRLFQGYSKGVLRESLQGILPEDVLWRTDKKGFTVPHEALTLKHLGDWEDVILRTEGLDWMMPFEKRKQLYKQQQNPNLLFKLASMGYYFRYLEKEFGILMR